MSDQENQRRQFWVILTIVFLGFIGISMPYLIFPALFLNPAYAILPASWSPASHAFFLGLTLAAYPLGQFVGSPILGALSDDYGRKLLLAASLVISALFNLLTGIAIEWHHVGLLILSRFMTGLMEGNVAIARAMATDLKTISKHQSLGKINASISIAYLIGPFLGGLMTDKSLLEQLTPSMPFYVISVLFVLLAVLAMIVLEKSPINPLQEVRTVWQRINLYQRVSALFANKQLKFLLITSTAFTLAVDIFYEFGPVYLTLKWALGPAQLTLYNGILCLGLAAGNGWLPGFFSSRKSHRTEILCAMGAFVFSLIGIVVIESTLLMLLFFGLCGLSIGLAVTLVTVKISDSAPDTIQGEVMGTQLSLRVLGDALICLFGSALLLISPKIILIIAAALAAATMPYYRAKRSL